MADMRSCYKASVATRGAETQIFINENEHTGCEGNVLQRDSWTGMWGSLPAIFHIVYNCGTLTRFFALAKKNSDDITFYLHGITRKTKFSQHMRDYFKKVVYFPGSSNNCATVLTFWTCFLLLVMKLLVVVCFSYFDWMICDRNYAEVQDMYDNKKLKAIFFLRKFLEYAYTYRL